MRCMAFLLVLLLQSCTPSSGVCGGDVGAVKLSGATAEAADVSRTLECIAGLWPHYAAPSWLGDPDYPCPTPYANLSIDYEELQPGYAGLTLDPYHVVLSPGGRALVHELVHVGLWRTQYDPDADHYLPDMWETPGGLVRVVQECARS